MREIEQREEEENEREKGKMNYLKCRGDFHIGVMAGNIKM